MKKSILIILSVVLIASLSAFVVPAGDSPDATLTAEKAMYSCPGGQVTIQGCVIDIDGCKYVETINGRTIAINLFNYPYGAGDNISATGSFVTDADCDPCVLNPSSVTDLGDCN